MSDADSNISPGEIVKNSKTNFLYSFSLLSKEKREAINRVYAFCRQTDDIADDEKKSKESRFLILSKWKNEFEKGLSGIQTEYSVINNLIEVINKFNIPAEHFFELISGMESDLKKNRYRTFSELIEYCYKAASTVGLMCIEIFGYGNPKTKEFAVNLGIAMQLTNILRDIKSDYQKGRIYIPQEDLRRFNYGESDLAQKKYNENFIRLMEFESVRAKYFYKEAKNSLAKEDKGAMFAALIMGNIYFRILKKIERNGYNVFEKKISISRSKKIMIMASVFVKCKLFGNAGEHSLALNGS